MERAGDLLPQVYDELRKLAAARLAHERPGQTLTATALVHEAYVRLVANPGRKPGGESLAGDSPPGLRPGFAKSSPEFANRAHFFAAAAEAMRRILIERARQKQGPQRGGGRKRVDLADIIAAADESPDELIDLDDALQRLSEEDPTAAQLANLRIFAGLSVDDAAIAMDMSRAAAYRHWTYARAWLRNSLQ